MFWGGIFYSGHIELVALPGARLTATRYTPYVLEPHVMPYGAYIGLNFTYMHDNARPQIAHIVQQYLEEVEIPLLPRQPGGPT